MELGRCTQTLPPRHLVTGGEAISQILPSLFSLQGDTACSPEFSTNGAHLNLGTATNS
jgi:hypothetical protein